MATSTPRLAHLATRLPPGTRTMAREQFSKHIVGEDQESYDIRAIDMDRDGDVDILIAGRGSKNVVWYENPEQFQR